MGKHYNQLSLCERIKIELLREQGLSLRGIGEQLGRSASTISRELRRNAQATNQWQGGYDGERADHLAARRRRWDARFKLARQPDLRATVRKHLAMGWSPQQVAGWLARTHGRTVISHESIYRYIYHRSAQKDYWHRLLPRAKFRRGLPGRRGGSPVDRIKRRRPLEERPSIASERQEIGHWEVDLMLFARYGQAVLVMHERLTRFTRIFRQPSKAAKPVIERLLDFWGQLPASLRRSATFDNGTEFAEHHQLIDKLGMQTYFCDPHAPWQKGVVENTIGRLRRKLPRKTNLAVITSQEVEAHADWINSIPRECLDFFTPDDLFSKNLSVALQA
ncbi:IS30 family transposase [Azospirillum sp. 412522]|nr:IS30 family transposase [Azospirillum sp. 412522]MBY6264294.1 IS30 family transposase [Azospirillum sp. 412522]